MFDMGIDRYANMNKIKKKYCGREWGVVDIIVVVWLNDIDGFKLK